MVKYFQRLIKNLNYLINLYYTYNSKIIPYKIILISLNNYKFRIHERFLDKYSPLPPVFY
jgi:hypothetical protein